MAMGIVPLIVDYAGPGELVDDEVGFKVPLGPREAIVAGFRDTLGRLCEDRSALHGMAVRGMARVAERHTWAAKAAAVSRVYARVLAGEPPGGDAGQAV
jgi:glycosyltransferase involved in cell wall biosynthesis